MFRREDQDGITLGMFIQAQHTNMIGICHGGVLMSLGDVAAAQGLNHNRGKLAGAPTLSLTFDFISAAKEGDWIEARADRVELKRLFGFSSGAITCNDKLICRFSGSFYTPDHDKFDSQIKDIAKLHGQG